MLDRTSKFVLVFSLILFPLGAAADHCTVSKIAIIPGSWENTATKTSLTLQAQDSAGTSCHVSQTLRFSLESNASGSFTTESGGSLSYFISSNSANRNFYYSGHPSAYTLTARAGYGTADSWVEQFSTTYSAGSVSSPSTAESSSASTNTSDSSGSSVHYNATALSSKKPEQVSSVSAGRDRVGTVGSPVEFRAETNFAYTKSTLFRWNFGDGSEGAGAVLNHVYDYPGEYTVVLNAALPEGQAVSKINVKIVDPQLNVVSANPQRIEIKNNSKHEANLYGHALAVGDNVFTFPLDTIIKPGQSLFFSSRVTGLRPTGNTSVSLVVVGDTEQPKIRDRIQEEKQKQIEKIYEELGSLESQLAAFAPNKTSQPVSPATGVGIQSAISETSDVEPALVLEAAKGVEGDGKYVSQGLWGKIKKFFLRTK